MPVFDMQAIKTQHRKYLVLRALYDDASYGLNERVLADFLKMYSLGGARDELRTLYDDLQREGFVEIAVVDEIKILSLTLRGAEMVERKFIAENIYRPGPGERY